MGRISFYNSIHNYHNIFFLLGKYLWGREKYRNFQSGSRYINVISGFTTIAFKGFLFRLISFGYKEPRKVIEKVGLTYSHNTIKIVINMI